MQESQIKCELLGHMGDDLAVVNAARVSFKTESEGLSEKDKRLLQFLARGCTKAEWQGLIEQVMQSKDPQEIEDILKYVKHMPSHWTPFSHAVIKMRETVPIFVARQRFKHTVGFTYNEVSRRYVDDEPSFYGPEVWRSRPDGSIKQGSGLSIDSDSEEYYQEYYTRTLDSCEECYSQMIADGVAPEQARMVLPQSMLTTYVVTGSLYAWANAYIQRSDGHAQKEIQSLASHWDKNIRPLFPVSWSALVD